MAPAAYCFHKTFERAGPVDFQTDRHYLVYALSGTMRLQAEGSRWTLPPARAALVAADQPISISILSKLTSASVLFETSFMPAPLRTISVFEMSPLARELIAECRAWGHERGELDPYFQEIFKALSAVVLRLAERPSTFVIPAPSSTSLARALELTEQVAHEGPRFEWIAKRTGQSPRALARRFSTELGMTWSQALRKIRILRAVEALATSNDSITEICMSVGYNSLSAFNAAFQDTVGMSPRAYRASLRG